MRLFKKSDSLIIFSDFTEMTSNKISKKIKESNDYLLLKINQRIKVPLNKIMCRFYLEKFPFLE